MLFSVEGGGFFSSSAIGYSKGLALLLLGPRNEGKPMKVAPWNKYQLVEQEDFPDFQLASLKIGTPRSCASFICFGRASTGTDGQFPPKVGPMHQSDISDPPLASDNITSTSSDKMNDSDGKACLRSSLKKHPANSSSDSSGLVGVSSSNDRRKVQWTDAYGRELAHIREFECSEDDASDDEYRNGENRNCQCVIQ
ncbi:hypothetical protein AXF42_Ash005312 [Apostasia shenzhenica]|uniref:Uncharacterized protein n=1 Tax=Apostasia shenzhenica TaxID=1088818 RepID=A0A2I0B6I8_9ASPA|nr:hypothetical protein AXF42_Ash005312 [Apostasia shenzhenica]